MGIRFARRVSLGKGLRLNVSKSGLGLSVGAPGLRLSFGKKGTYLNTGIPGTGISSRKKIGGGRRSSAGSRGGSSSPQSTGGQAKISFMFDDETGKESLVVKDMNDNIINDETLLRRFKRSDQYKTKIAELREQFFKEQKEKNDILIDIYKNSEELVKKEAVEQVNNELKPGKYSIREFDIPQPDKGRIREELFQRSAKEIKTKKFWAKKKMRWAYVDENFEEEFQKNQNGWEQKKTQHFEEEKKREIEQNKEHIVRYEEEKVLYKKILSGDMKYIEDTLTAILEEIQLPVDFSVSFDVKPGKVFLDVDLPEIEDYPMTFPNQLASGKISIKKKSATAMKEDYARSVIGIAYFFASIVFNISPAINNIEIAGYTQRMNKKTGKVEDEYIYTIDYDRAKFGDLVVANIDPIESVQLFSNKMDMIKSFDFKTITV